MFCYNITDDALRAVSTMMFTPENDRPHAINIACFLTDGKASDKRRLFEAANEAKKKGRKKVLIGPLLDRYTLNVA